MAISVLFGMLLLWMDFSDASPLSGTIGNLDHVFGNAMWHPLEVLLPLASIALFLLSGKVFLDIGKSEARANPTGPRFSIARLIVLFLIYGGLLVLIDLDDILKILHVQSNLRVSNLSPGYWIPIEIIYPVFSLVVFTAFGRACFEFGKMRTIARHG